MYIYGSLYNLLIKGYIQDQLRNIRQLTDYSLLKIIVLKVEHNKDKYKININIIKVYS